MRQTGYTGVNLFHNAEEGVKMNSEKWMTLNDPTERIVYACNPSGMNFIKHYLFGVLLLPIIVGVFFILYAMVMTKLTKYIVTNKRVIVKTGFFNKRQSEIWVEDMRGVSMTRTLWQQIIGAGDVVIGTAATADDEIVVMGIAKPQSFIDAVNEQRHNQKEG